MSVGDDQIVCVGVGCTFGETCDVVEKNSLSVMGARNLNVSASGLLLGGKSVFYRDPNWFCAYKLIWGNKGNACIPYTDCLLIL